MESNQLKHWIAFNKIPGIGRSHFALMEKRFGDLSEAWRAGESELREAGMDAGALAQVAERRPAIDPDRELERLDEVGVRAVTWHDDEYPPRLREFTDKPPLLFVRGELLPEDERSIAVVGTRRASPYGREMAQRLATDLARAGVVVVSGLARGIDGIAHRAALDAGQRTIAVMGSGMDTIYPAEHSNLASEIAANGAVITEFALGTQPNPGNFPRRNRIMAGMTLGTLVVEAPEKSGALFTAKYAIEDNRDVFAVPGNALSPGSRGANRLIRDSAAKLVMDSNDILEELNIDSVGAQMELAALIPQDENEAAVLSHVSYDIAHIDEIVRNSGLPITTVSGALSMMELKGLVKQVGGMNYVRIMEPPAQYTTTAG